MDTRIHCNSSVCKQSDRPCSKLNDELYDRIAKRVPNLDRATFDDVMSPQRSTESTGLSLKIPARCPSSKYTSASKRLPVQNSTSSDESVSAKSSGTPPNSRIQTLSQKLEAKSRENDELRVELTNLEKQKSETEAEILAACTAANERAEREANLRREMELNVTPQEQIDALKKDLEGNDLRRFSESVSSSSGNLTSPFGLTPPLPASKNRTFATVREDWEAVVNLALHSASLRPAIPRFNQRPHSITWAQRHVGLRIHPVFWDKLSPVSCLSLAVIRSCRRGFFYLVVWGVSSNHVVHSWASC
ncbi:hypothetical protein EDD85DRAFT_831750 [Armillaria nabsnona]|nr:hypothetical protein EDD85DRAFT_831750 [Armillaria nabsnona]